MECPYCQKDIYAMTGLQEVLKFQKHLDKCKKNPNSIMSISKNGLCIRKTELDEALEIRAKSGQ